MKRSTRISLMAATMTLALLPIWTLVEGRPVAVRDSSTAQAVRQERDQERRQKLSERAEAARAEQRQRLEEEQAERSARVGAPRRGTRAGTSATPGFAPGDRSLTLDKDLALGASSNVSKDGYPWLWSDSGGNSGFGLQALSSTTSGNSNTAAGYYALYGNTQGSNNTALGAYALESNLESNYNTAVGSNALSTNDSGYSNTAVGAFALTHNTTGGGNTAIGDTALFYTDGGGVYLEGSLNTAVGINALFLNTTGSFNTAVGRGALFSNLDSINLTAVGNDALASNTTITDAYGTYSGYGNTAVGALALSQNTVGSANTAVGNRSLEYNLTGSNNTAMGFEALANSTTSGNAAVGSWALYNSNTGYANTAVGTSALYSNTSGYSNTAVGYYALYSLTGGYYNTAIGNNAGNVYPPIGSYNILIGNTGVAYDQATIRLGIQGRQLLTYVAGVYGTPGPGAAYVHVSPAGQLVQGAPVPPSSRRFKTDIQDMGAASELLADLRPVTFVFKEEFERGRPGLQFGLIAEEVAEIFPQLVEYDEEGRPYTVRYRLLTPLLLNELLEQQRLAGEQSAEIARLREETRRLARLVEPPG